MDEQAVTLKQNFFLRWGSTIFLVFAFLIPIFFIPSANVAFQFGKGFFIFSVVLVLAILFLLGVLKEGKVSIPKSWTLLGLAAVLLAYVISGIFSNGPLASLLGQGFEIDTAAFALIGLLLALLVPLAFKQKTSLFNVYIALLISFFVAALFNIIRFFSPGFLSFGVLTGNVSNMVGSWNDLGIFAGFVTILSLISLGVLEARGMWRNLLYLGLVVGVFMLAAVNFNVLWYVMTFFSLVFFIYSLSYAKNRGGSVSTPARVRQISWAPVFVLIISVVFIFFGTGISNTLSNLLNTSNIEARPSFSTTFSIGKEVYKAHPVLGAGPNRFVNQWLLNKPVPVNESVFWNVDFTSAVGTIPTSLITLGALGIIAWLIFLGLFLFEGIMAIRRLHGDAFAHYLAFSSFAGAFYFWLMAILYTPTHSVYSLAFLFTGVFVATLVLEGIIPEARLDFSSNPGKSFVGSLASIVSIIIAATGIFLTVSRFSSFWVFNKAVSEYSSKQDLNAVEAGVKQALLFDNDDVFYRTLSDIYMARLNQILQQNPIDSEVDALRNQFQQYLSGAVASSQAAVKINPNNYQNWISLAGVYSSVVPLKINGAYDEAIKAYGEATKLNPTGPAIPLSVARLEVANGNNKAARADIANALSLKSNYTDAAFLLAQIEVADGNTRKAIDAVSSAALLSPTNPVIFFQLGFLQYNNRNWSEAAKALEQAIQLQPQYANAEYFLGLSYYNLGRSSDAVKQFNDLASTNPNNDEVKLILTNLKAGRAPFTSVAPPLDNKPEKRKVLPISDTKNQTETQN